MRLFVIACLAAALSACSTPPAINVTTTGNNVISGTPYKSVVADKSWIHGSPDCDLNQDPVIDSWQYDDRSFILRQNKCLTAEAPFIYVLTGTRKILVLDTGDLNNIPGFSLYQEVRNLVDEKQLAGKEILVIHSHGHRDHTRGDSYFAGQPGVTVIAPSEPNLAALPGAGNWPETNREIDLGNRRITLIATPGHQEQAITLYDHANQWLLTGDTLYPGYIYIKDWAAYKNSITRLADFAGQYKVAAVLGSHIEMTTTPGQHYPIGTTYQPHEAQLDISVNNLHALNAELKRHNKPVSLIFADFIIVPMSALQKQVSNLGKWLLP
ncbi:MBL fold metallo-hydrolase [Endozoicomonadaceae bacterium StTr2]